MWIRKFISREALNNMMKLFAFIPDKQYLQIMYRIRLGKKLHLDNPQTFNEKIQWLKLYDRNPQYTIMVDKYEAKKYVSDIIGDEYIIPTLGVWDRFEDIDFDMLPNQFVLKCTHDSGGVVICRDKKTLNIKKAQDKIEKSLKSNFYYVGREWPYKGLKRRIIAEKLLLPIQGNCLIEYKIFCFYGVPKVFLVCMGNAHGVGRTNDFYDMNFNHIPVTGTYPNLKTSLSKPKEYDEIVDIAKKLSIGIPQVRVDLYSTGNKIYFGELTFSHDSGFCRFQPSKYDYEFGQYIALPK